MENKNAAEEKTIESEQGAIIVTGAAGVAGAIFVTTVGVTGSLPAD